MKPITKALAGVTLMVLSNSILAAVWATTTDPNSVTLPQFDSGYMFGLTSLYLQPAATGGDLNYARDSNNRIRVVNPGYAFGYGINLAYLFANTSNDVNLSYFHVDTSDFDTIAAANGSIMPFDFPVIFADPTLQNLTSQINTADATVNFTLDQLNIGVGQYFDIGNHWRFHASTGLGYADLQRDLITNYRGVISANNISPVPFLLSSDQKGNFRGFGPFIGLDSQYYLTQHFALVYQMAAEILVGRKHADINFTLNENNSPQSSPQAVISTDLIQTVPNAEAKIGADYNWLFTDQSALTLELGYEVDKYFNANNLLMTNLAFPQVISNSTTTITSNIHSTSDSMSFSGPYLNLTFHGIKTL